MAQSDLAGKVILLTGATDGIGKAAAFELVQRGASLTIVGRSETKTRAVLDELRAVASGKAKLDYLVCDLSRPADVNRAAEEFASKNDRLDVLANNAGALFQKTSATPDRNELSFALNHLAYFQMTRTLLPLLRKTPGARVVCTTSSIQEKSTSRVYIERVNDVWKGWEPWLLGRAGSDAYGASKLSNVMFVQELQRRLDKAGDAVVASSFDPGTCKTQFGAFGRTSLGWLLDIIFWFLALGALRAEDGGNELVWMATAPETAKFKGKYVSKRKVTEPNEQASDEKLARDLWDLSERLCDEAINKSK